METEKYLGYIKEIEDTEFWKIIADVPGFIDGIEAFPKRSELDEPKVGDAIILTCFDPIYNSYYIYEKVKEDEFIGFRAAGKMVDITEDSITVGIYPKDQSYDLRPECTAVVKVSDSGDIEIYTSKGNISVTTDSGDVTIDSSGEVNLGAGATESLVLGDTFKEIFNSHTHTITPGSPVSGKPIIGMNNLCLSDKVKTE